MTHLTTRRGDEFIRTTTLYDELGAAYDLTGTTVWFTIKDTSDTAAGDDESIVAAWWEDGGDEQYISVTDPETGGIRIAIPRGVTATLSASRVYLYDIQIDDNAGKQTTPEVGTIGVLPDVTIRTTAGAPVAP